MAAPTTGIINVTFTWDATPPPNDECPAAALLADGDAFVADLTSALPSLDVDANHARFPDLWYRFVTPSAGTIELSTCNSASGYPVLAAFSTCASLQQSIVRVSENCFSGNTRAAVLYLTAPAGASLYFRLSRNIPDLVNVSFTFTSAALSPPNDACTHAMAVVGNASVATSLRGATPTSTSFEIDRRLYPDLW